MKLLYRVFYSLSFMLLVIIIAYGLGELFGFAISDFWEGWLLAVGSGIGLDVYQNKHYKLVERGYDEWK